MGKSNICCIVNIKDRARNGLEQERIESYVTEYEKALKEIEENANVI